MLNMMDSAGHRSSNSVVINIFSQRIRENIEVYFPGIDTRLLDIRGKAIGGPYAQTFKFWISDGRKSYEAFAKICPVFERLNPAKLEYETLNLLYHKMSKSNSRYSVARPLDFFPDLNAYVMESVGNWNFKNYLLKNNSILSSTETVDKLKDIVAGSAIWLKMFHEMTRSEKELKFNSSAFFESIREDFDYLLLSTFSFKQSTVNKLEDIFAKLPLLDNKYAIPSAKWHWDYTPGHVFLDNGKISVIDILGLDDALIYEDIGHFLVAMAITNNLPFYLLFDRKRASTEFDALFMEAYWDGSSIDKRQFILFSKLYKLKYFILYFGGQYTRVSEKVHPLVGKVFANLRSAKIIEGPMMKTIYEIETILNEFIK